ncbi:glycoside hydrolase family 128 protein [Amorphotheca resinae ATCC 22711]|uniref:Glycoside hydrolase family 128 protein n=1 Tax=Amorphotheca resinae ATCC 22711 TaxID=857342 RepID=A0A2T3AZG7_AMORE|nr:glycoside hydrolase family 128 protein [Amorphotheca resinae ATCC 22711]PSS16545.1 glycoside hydrolase family 128 protein [Amorphotheca resinae ATCC 22711]
MALAQATFQRSSKRGLVFVPNSKYPDDNKIWIESGSDLTWYYNYGVQPSPVYSSAKSQSDFEFVPMLWGLSDTSFLTEITTLTTSGTNISHVLTFNEPDSSSAYGGSNIEPAAAAKTWIQEVEPLRKMGIRTGAPAVTGSPGGFTWLQQFFANCTSQGTNCTADFIPVHWYGDFQGLASHLGQVSATFPNTSIWVTEYALNNQSLATTQSFFNTSAQYLDRLSSIERYSYFGAFRSDDSNVGPNAAMLTQKGQLTDIGSWYLGGKATTNIPSAAAAARWPGVWVGWGLLLGVLGLGL